MEIENKIENEIVEYNSSENNVEKKQKIIVFCLIGNNFSEKFLRNWTEIIGYCLTNGIKPVLSNYSGYNTFILKNACMLGQNGLGNNQVPFQNKINYDYIVIMDEKYLFTVSHLKAFLTSNKNVIAGVSTNEFNYNLMNYIENVDFMDPARYEYVKMDDYEDCKIERKLLKVDYVQLGVIMLKNGVLEKIGFPWFNYDEQTQDLKGELYFCRKCKENDIDIYVYLEQLVSSERAVLI
jgi:hypothetical protein